MIGYLEGRTRPYYFRRCKKERPTTTSIDSLPDELLFSILVCLPADYLHDIARLVCRRWYHIIHSKSFINAHFQQSTYGLLFPFRHSPPVLMTATATQGGGRGSLVQTNAFGYKSRIKFLGTCNGLIMEVKHNHPRCVHVINPTTKQAFVLPSLPPCDAASHIRHRYCGIAYAAASMEYKVAVLDKHEPFVLLKGAKCPSIHVLAILTVGVDNSWRQVRLDHLSKDDWGVIAFRPRPVITEGFMHWMGTKRIVSLDVETEILTGSEAPDQLGNYTIYLSTGRSLTLLIEIEDLFFQVWEMNPETKESIKLVNEVDLRAQEGWIKQFSTSRRTYLVPIGWVKYPEVLLLCYFYKAEYHRTCVFYNLDTHEITLTELTELLAHIHGTVFKNSLTWLT